MINLYNTYIFFLFWSPTYVIININKSSWIDLCFTLAYYLYFFHIYILLINISYHLYSVLSLGKHLIPSLSVFASGSYSIISSTVLPAFFGIVLLLVLILVSASSCFFSWSCSWSCLNSVTLTRSPRCLYFCSSLILFYFFADLWFLCHAYSDSWVSFNIIHVYQITYHFLLRHSRNTCSSC